MWILDKTLMGLVHGMKIKKERGRKKLKKNSNQKKLHKISLSISIVDFHSGINLLVTKKVDKSSSIGEILTLQEDLNYILKRVFKT